MTVSGQSVENCNDQKIHIRISGLKQTLLFVEGTLE